MKVVLNLQTPERVVGIPSLGDPPALPLNLLHQCITKLHTDVKGSGVDLDSGLAESKCSGDITENLSLSFGSALLCVTCDMSPTQ